MKPPRSGGYIVLGFLAAVSARPSVVQATVTLDPLFCEHAVLQQAIPVPVWGTAEPGEAVNVTFLDQHYDTTTDAQGRWMTRLEPLRAGQVGTLVIRGRNTLSFPFRWRGRIMWAFHVWNRSRPGATACDSG